MSNLDKEQELKAPEKKKVNLEEAIKQKLASKKQNQATGRNESNPVKMTQSMKSQQTKKRNNQRKRTGV
ncbi:hypothetical protein [Priestia abyssalis]|uniref:hypothetical protein n=1 Tax=Priestia abyssalis TaxID=1221450 RepID=UPI000994B8B2|nr:hypothetical protein [Priestia abyssalis]